MSSRIVGDRCALNEWKRSTVQRTARWSDFLQFVGIWGTGKDLPAFGPDLVVHVQEKGWEVKNSKTNLGMAGGV